MASVPRTVTALHTVTVPRTVTVPSDLYEPHYKILSAIGTFRKKNARHVLKPPESMRDSNPDKYLLRRLIGSSSILIRFSLSMGSIYVIF